MVFPYRVCRRGRIAERLDSDGGGARAARRPVGVRHNQMSRRSGVSDSIDDREAQGFGAQTKLRAAPRSVQVLHDVVVTGVGAVLPNCDSREVFWQKLRVEESQLAIEPDPADGIPCAIGRVRDSTALATWRGVSPRLLPRCLREQQLYLASIVQAARAQASSSATSRGIRPASSTARRGATSRTGTSDSSQGARQEQPLHAARFELRHAGQAVGMAAAILGVQGPTFTSTIRALPAL